MNPTLSLTALALALTTPALAGTPDGLPPSVETVCDDYEGAAYGLCTAYCEAMDCDSPDARASDEACERVAANFEAKTGGDVLPCDVAECVVSAEDDHVVLYSDGPFTVSVLDNDTPDPEDATLAIVSDTAPTGITLEGGVYSGSWNRDISATYDVSFEYTVCCDGGSSCDSATVTIYGS